MPVKSTYTHYALNKIKKYTTEVRTFLGVDYSTQKFLIPNGRAIDLKNFIYKNGITQKRHGYEQILTVPTKLYIPASFDKPSAIGIMEIHSNENAKQINGIWSFEAEDKQIHTVAHIGCLMYEIKNLDDDNKPVEAELMVTGSQTANGNVYPLTFEFENYKSFAFVGGNKLWFFGGNKYMCLRFTKNNYTEQITFLPVENSNVAPIPTTCQGISYKNAISSQRELLDKPNLMTRWRKNQLVSGTTKQEDENTKTKYFEYTLDAPIYPLSEQDMANITVVIEERGVIE